MLWETDKKDKKAGMCHLHLPASCLRFFLELLTA